MVYLYAQWRMVGFGNAECGLTSVSVLFKHETSKTDYGFMR